MYDTLVLRSGKRYEHLDFFSVPVGQESKGFESTNMELQNQLPKSTYFELTGIALIPDFRMAQLFKNSHLEFMIGSWIGVRDNGFSFIRRSGYEEYPVKTPLTITPQQNFGARLKFNEEISLNFDYPIRCELMGNYYQLVQ